MDSSARARLRLVDEYPCDHPDTCGPQQPICLACTNGMRLFLDQTGSPPERWAELEEWKRACWRAEARAEEG